MASIFVSYRRSDAPGHAGRLYDRLAERFGEANVFKDLDSMEPGVDFEEVLNETLAVCDAVIAVIGRNWLSPSSEEGSSRLDDPDDWVRVELATALSRKIRVVPVLVEGATMPASSELPEDVRPLTRRHAAYLSEMSWNVEVMQLIDSLSARLDVAASEAPAPPIGRPADHSSSGDRQKEHSTGGWSVNGQWSSDRVLSLEMSSPGKLAHVLTLREWDRKREGKLAGPLATLDGEEVDYSPPTAAGAAVGGFLVALGKGGSLGALTFSMSDGELEWVVLHIDTELVYAYGDAPDYM
jgi:hypothetical protein